SGYLLARVRPFAWGRFFLVFRWALLAYVISAGMIGFAFVKDHVRGAPLALVLVMLVIYALDVPLVIAFTVARYSSPAGHAGPLPDLFRTARGRGRRAGGQRDPHRDRSRAGDAGPRRGGHRATGAPGT